MNTRKAREKAIQSLVRQKNVQLERLARGHAEAKNKLAVAKRSYSEVKTEVGDIEDQIRESTKEGAAISVNMLLWQRLHLNQQNDLLIEKKLQKDQADEHCREKYAEFVGQKQIVETFDRLAEKYKEERKKLEYKRISLELDAISTQKSARKE
jgi:hypothetical protein